LQVDDYVDKRRIRPGLLRALLVRCSNDVSGCFFYNAETVEFQLAEDRGLA
jgi:hypothetical protein